jgi:hypothetical protein
MDVALNHSFGLSPMVQMYWDTLNNRPSVNNPWFNSVAKHAYNVGYDFNHESIATRYFTSRVMEHWLSEYKIDGFRFDLSKGFTQTQTCDNAGSNCNVSTWSAYDQSRINIWNRYYDTLQLKSPGCYAILEHFADNSEEQLLSNKGFLLWGNLNYNYAQSSMGYSSSCDLSSGIHTNRGWSNPHLVTYAESHDEERINYKNINYGNASGSYNIKDTNTAPKRMELAHAFLLTIPGPKMIWQFGELGYDSSINFCQNGTINSNCRLDMKPIKWSYFNDPERKSLYNVIGNLNRLRNNATYSPLFTSNNITYNLSGLVKWLKITQGAVSIMVIGNFDVVSQTVSFSFPAAGTWYNYLNPGTVFTTGGTENYILNPGEYRVYINQFVALPVSVLNFNGRNEGTINHLNWQVENQEDVLNYELQFSTNGKDFEKISKLTVTNSGNYFFDDNIQNNINKTFFYRIKINEKNGGYRYSNILKINASFNKELSVSINNPVKDNLKVTVESFVNQNVIFVLSDISGRQLKTFSKSINSGINTFDLCSLSTYSNGFYILSIKSDLLNQSFKIIKGNQ